MEIRIDYWVRRKCDNKLMGTYHLTLSEQDILDFAAQKAEETWTISDERVLEPQIDKIII